MKKIYSLLAAVALTATVNAQTTVVSTITGINGSGTVATTNEPADSNLAFKAQVGASTANAPAYFSVSGNTPGHLRMYSLRASGEGNTFTITPASGYVITSVSFTVLTDKPTVTYSVASGDTQTATLSGATYTLANSAETAGALTFKNAHTGGSSNLQLRIPAITVTYKTAATMAVVDAAKVKVNLVKNTIVSNELIFAASSNVTVYNTAGQVVKAAEVTDNSRLDVSALPNGTYVVTGLVNGQTISQKIIKK